MHLRLGSNPAIFISSPSLAEQVLKTHSALFPDRPRSEASVLVSFGLKGFAFNEHGPYWREVRKICAAHLLSPAKLGSYEFVRKEELAGFVSSLKEAAEAGVAVDVTAKVRSVAYDMMYRTLIGRKSADGDGRSSKFREHVEEGMRVVGLFNWNDFVPMLSWFDLQGVRRQATAAKKRIDAYLERIISEHESLKGVDDYQPTPRCFLDVLLDAAAVSRQYKDDDPAAELDRDSVKAIILDILNGAMDTNPGAIEWAFAELLRHPEAMKKLRDELESAVGLHRAVEESDLSKLPYLAMVLKESLRLHHLGPFHTRCATKDFNLAGYHVPKGSGVLVCSWAMGRDPDLWPNAEEFVPERFEESGVDVKGHDFHLLPFGSGRRACPGMGYGMLVNQLVVAQLVHCFDWELPGGMPESELDMAENYGMTMPRAKHLHAIPTNYRLKI